ncbi:MAG: amidohydrolase family protein [Desulfobacterales bacterium]|nr:MAG: amidohydrolase family protein [Desulfobacterales bacterium]
MNRIVIKNGTIVDGTGAAPCRGDVVIRGEEIEAIGSDVSLSPDTPRIDVPGCIVCPGFIDTHSHSDFSLLVNPDAESALYQGVTTEVIGNCGLSIFPIAGRTKNLLQSYIMGLGYDSSFTIDWTDLAGYAAAFDQSGIGINVVPLAGHGSIRIAVMGFGAREANSQELAAMKIHLETALDQGAWGLSSGLVYPPGINSPPHELEVLCEMVADRGALYTTHLRGDTLRSGVTFIESLAEALSVARRTGVRLHVSHASPKFPNTGSVHSVIKMMQALRDEGFHVTCDAHPYLAAMTFLASLLPPWAFEGGIRETVRRFNDPRKRKQVIEAVKATFEHLDPSDFWPRNEVILPDPQSEFNHCRMHIISQKMELQPAEALIEILAQCGQRLFEAIVLQWIYSAEETQELFHWPYTTVGADGATSSLAYDLGPLTIHPRSWGTFPKIFNDYHKKGKQFSIEEIIRRMTGLAAAVVGLNDRGTIQPKKKADVIVFNPKKFTDTATYADPHRYAQGMEFVWVNGRMVVERGKRTGRRPGKVIKR